MPRTTLCKTKDEEQTAKIRGMLTGGLEINGISKPDAAKRLGLSSKCIYNYLAEPYRMPLTVFIRLCNMAGVKFEISANWGHIGNDVKGDRA